MLTDLKVKTESTSRNTACTISKKEKEIVSDEHTDSDTVSSVSATKAFGNDFPQIKRFVGNPKPMSFKHSSLFLLINFMNGLLMVCLNKKSLIK